MAPEKGPLLDQLRGGHVERNPEILPSPGDGFNPLPGPRGEDETRERSVVVCQPDHSERRRVLLLLGGGQEEGGAPFREHPWEMQRGTRGIRT